MILHGGGSTAPEATQAFIKAAGGPEAPILVLPQVTEGYIEKAKVSSDWLRENGAKNVNASLVNAPDDPLLPGLVVTLRAMAESGGGGVWIPGGDQTRFMKIFAGTPVPPAIQKLLIRGGAVGGSSAGTALAGEWMPTGEGDKTSLKQDSVETMPGLNLLPGVIVDTHFLVRERTQRLLNMVVSRPERTGIGVDERAWIRVEGKANRVTVEAGQVVIIRCVGPTRRDREGQLSAKEVRLRVLLPGESVSLSELKEKR